MSESPEIKALLVEAERRGLAAVKAGRLWPATPSEVEDVRVFLNDTRPNDKGIFFNKQEQLDDPPIADQVFDSNSQLVSTIQRVSRNNSAVASTNFTQASFRENAQGEYRRTKNLISRLRALWLDCDIRPGERGKYKTYSEALDHLSDFDEATGLSADYVIDSGSGLHVYYSLGSDLTHDTWTPIAKDLKLALKSFGIAADYGVTVSGNQPLRLPYSLNLKQNRPPKLVHFLQPQGFRLKGVKK